VTKEGACEGDRAEEEVFGALLVGRAELISSMFVLLRFALLRVL
jgi:hypothetical protein